MKKSFDFNSFVNALIRTPFSVAKRKLSTQHRSQSQNHPGPDTANSDEQPATCSSTLSADGRLTGNNGDPTADRHSTIGRRQRRPTAKRKRRSDLNYDDDNPTTTAARAVSNKTTATRANRKCKIITFTFSSSNMPTSSDHDRSQVNSKFPALLPVQSVVN